MIVKLFMGHHTSSDGTVIAAAHNEVPQGSEPCIRHKDYLWCARDVIQELVAQGLKHCPSCGQKIETAFACAQCGEEVDGFKKRCPSCGGDPGIVYMCKCGLDVFRDWLPGRQPHAGKLLDVCRALHAEENAILDLVSSGRGAPDEAVLYTTTFPCSLCAKKIVTVGIKNVVYAEPYPMDESRELFLQAGVEVRRFEGVKSTAYFRLYG